MIQIIQQIINNIWIGDWQDAKYYQKEFDDIFTTAKDSPFIGNHYYPLIDGPYIDNERLLYLAIHDLAVTRTEHYGNILVHCISGISRSTAVIAGYMIRKGYTTEDALYDIKKIRPIANPVQDFVVLLHKYERDMRTINL